MVRQVALPPRAQVLHDLCVVARADGHVGAGERAVLDDIARRLGVVCDVVCSAMEGRADLD